MQTRANDVPLRTPRRDGDAILCMRRTPYLSKRDYVSPEGTGNELNSGAVRQRTVLRRERVSPRRNSVRLESVAVARDIVRRVERAMAEEQLDGE